MLTLSKVSDGPALKAHDSPQALAFDWITEDDELRVCPDDPNVVQRYVLGVLYFATSGDSWHRCAVKSEDCDGSNFLSGTHECSWGGVVCDDQGNIIEIHLQENNLVGRLPDEIGDLEYLEELDLSKNSLIGTLPPSLGLLQSLEYLDMEKNRLSGPIPVELYDAVSLRAIDLDSNNLRGRIATNIGQLQELYFLQLDFNAMAGIVPTQLGDLPRLEYVSLFLTNVTALPENICGREVALYANCDVCTIDGCCTVCLAI